MKKLHSFAAALTVLTALTALAGTAAAAPVLYQQAWSGAAGGYADQNEVGGRGNFAKMYDDFRLGSTATVSGIGWHGGSFNSSKVTITSFLVQIFADAGGPGALLLSESFAGSGNETLVSGQNYRYDVDLTTDFAAQAGVTYWLAIQPTTTAGPQWGWGTSSVGNRSSRQDFFGSRYTTSSDLAFSLTSNAEVPEPSALALVALALAAAGLARRRAGA